jgi:tRNA(Ile)-lysidine synthase
LLPLLEHEYASGMTRRLSALAEEMAELDTMARAATRTELERRLDGDALRLEGFHAIPGPHLDRLLREFVERRIGSLRHFERKHIAAMRQLCCSENPSGRLDLPLGYQFRREYERAFLACGASLRCRPFSLPLRIGGAICTPGGFSLQVEIKALDDISAAPRVSDRMMAVFDYDQLGAPLLARSVEPGDRIRPLGVNGTRKLQDVFVDRKLPRALRARWPIVAAGEELVWAPGMVRSRVALVGPETRNLLCIRVLNDGATSELDCP